MLPTGHLTVATCPPASGVESASGEKLSSSIRLEKPWRGLTPEEVELLPGQLGVFQLADDDGDIRFIGYAGGHSKFGLQSELEKWIDEPMPGVSRFRYEVTMQYLTRYEELLMVFVADHGRLPAENRESMRELGRLHLG